MTITFGSQTSDPVWGCTYQEVSYSLLGKANVKMGFVEVTDLKSFATRVTHEIINRSWMSKLSPIGTLAYDATVTKTAAKLSNISKKTSSSGTLDSSFGELMVSIGSGYALEKIFTHSRVPLAELWKPKLSQNEGFDFHTTCQANLVNFGEAKYSANISSYKSALSQAEQFIDDQKHYMDLVHLRELVDPIHVNNLVAKQFGVIAGFSVKGKRTNLIFSHAIQRAIALASKGKATNLYLIGVKK